MAVTEYKEPRPAQQSCRNCTFFRANGVEFLDNDTPGGSCQRYPPTFLGGDDEEGTDAWGWPSTRDTDWCGEFQKG